MSKSFEVHFSLVVEQNQEDGKATPFFSDVIEYHGINYAGLLALEIALHEAIGKMTNLGVLQLGTTEEGQKIVESYVPFKDKSDEVLAV